MGYCYVITPLVALLLIKGGLAVKGALRVHIRAHTDRHKHTRTHAHTHTHTQDDIFADQQVGPVFNDDGMCSCVANVLLMCVTHTHTHTHTGAH